MIYFDSNATSKLIPEVQEHIIKQIKENKPLNPSSIHKYGQNAKAIIENARHKIKSLLLDKPKEYQLYFTSSCTEANNQILKTFNENIVIGPNEHSSISKFHEINNINKFITEEPLEIDIINFTNFLKDLLNKKKIQKGFLVSISYADTEIGIIQKLNHIKKIVHDLGGYIHSDITGALGKIKIDTQDIDYITFSGHKIGGLHGSAGILAKNNATFLQAQIFGGGQERGLRSGTENALAISTLPIAIKNALNQQEAFYEHTKKIQSYIEEEVKNNGGYVIGHQASRMPNTSCISMINKSKHQQLIYFDTSQIMISTGSACNAGSLMESETLKHLKLNPEIKNSAIRISTDLNNSIVEAEKFIEIWKKLKNG